MKIGGLVVSITMVGCFAPTRPSDDGDDATDASSGTHDTFGGGTGSEHASGVSAESASAEGTSEAAGAGPQLLSSLPADGEQHAGLVPGFRLYFDRDVGLVDAVGRLGASLDGGPEQQVFPVECWPEHAPNCIGVMLGADFQQPEAYGLPTGATITVRIAADLPDLDGNTNSADQLIEYRTFEVDYDFSPHSGWIGGITFDPGSSALYVVDQYDTLQSAAVARIPVLGGPAVAVAGLGVNAGTSCDAIQAAGGALYVPCSGTATVFVHTDLTAADLSTTQTAIDAPSFEFLNCISSTAVVAGNMLFSGCAGPTITRLDAGGVWSVFHTGEGLWADPWEVTVAAATIGGVDYVFAAADDRIYKLRLDDASVVSSFQPADVGELSFVDMDVDSHGRLWLGTWLGIFAFDGVSDLYQLLASREGINAAAFALREDGDTMHVYYAAMTEDESIAHLTIEP